MDSKNNLSGSEQNVNVNFEREVLLEKLRKEIGQSLNGYRNTLRYLASDVPISAMCLPKKIERILLSAGFLRVYDLINSDFAKIEGLDNCNIRELTARFDEFFSML